jgi:glycosyltransferase involved in cell wall biosynthesis
MASVQHDAAGAAPAAGVSVVVCTKDRPRDLPVALTSILTNDTDFELLVIDQSIDDETSSYVASLDDARIRYVRTPTTGLSRARNIGLEMARGEAVLMTDDDCEVPDKWVDLMAAEILANEEVGCVFGDVASAECDTRYGFIPESVLPRERTVSRCSAYDPRYGIGASIGVRRSVALDIGGFDEELGAGAPLKSAEEHDLALRMLLSRHRVRHSKAAPVVHFGFRTHSEGRWLIRGYMLGTAAAHVKLARRGHPVVLLSFARAVYGSLVPPILDAIRERNPMPIAGRLLYLWKGAVVGARAPVEHGGLRFRHLPSAIPAANGSR